MKKTAVAFFTASNGEKLEDDINKFFRDHAFTLTNVCYGCCYEISRGKTVHNAMVTYQYVVPDHKLTRETYISDEQFAYSIM
jgi:hypothetical protein